MDVLYLTLVKHDSHTTQLLRPLLFMSYFNLIKYRPTSKFIPFFQIKIIVFMLYCYHYILTILVSPTYKYKY